MRKLFKKVMAVALSATLVTGMTTSVFAAHAANGANVVPGDNWQSFSIISKEDGGEWYNALVNLRTDEFPNGQVEGTDFATYGYFYKPEGATASHSASGFNYYAKSTGWDGSYHAITGELIGDNPYGMRVFMEGIPVEKGRAYTISFQIKSTLKNIDKDKETGKYNTVKHILFNAHKQTPKGDNPGIDFTSVSGMKDGYIVLDSANTGYQTITATVKIPEDYDSEYMGVLFTLGANLYTFPKENNMRGSIEVKDFKVIAGTQHQVKFISNGKTKKTVYVNNNAKLSTIKVTRKGYTFLGWYNGKTKVTNSTKVTKDMKVTAKWKKTASPAKGKVNKVQSKKSKQLTVTLKKQKNVSGYQVQVSTTKKFKKVAKTVNSKKNVVTVKKLKSGVKYFVRVKAYNVDSTGKKVFAKKWSAVKSRWTN